MTESFSDRPSWAAKSCCEEAALNAAEVVRLHDQFAALADQIMALANGDEEAEDEQRIEEQAKALHGELHPFGPSWENTGDYAQRCYITAIRAGWTPPESEA